MTEPTPQEIATPAVENEDQHVARLQSVVAEVIEVMNKNQVTQSEYFFIMKTLVAHELAECDKVMEVRLIDLIKKEVKNRRGLKHRQALQQVLGDALQKASVQ